MSRRLHFSIALRKMRVGRKNLSISNFVQSDLKLIFNLTYSEFIEQFKPARKIVSLGTIQKLLSLNR